MRLHLIKTDGTEQNIEGQFTDIPRLIGAKLLDSINLRDGRVMMVDDLGYVTTQVDLGTQETTLGKAHVFERVALAPKKPVNAKATALYHSVCRPGTTHQIVGDVIVVVDADVD